MRESVGEQEHSEDLCIRKRRDCNSRIKQTDQNLTEFDGRTKEKVFFFFF
jgi:hypothetical protein